MNQSKEDKSSLDRHVGIRLKRERLAEALKITDIAAISGISQGMISKIENAQVSPSLETIDKLCNAIGIPVAKLFSDYNLPDGGALFTKAGNGIEVVRRGTEKGHTYRLLGYQRGSHRHLEPFLVSIDDLSETFPTFSHPGEEFIYLLKGKLTYRVGNKMYEMTEGDSLAFNGELPHGPEKLTDVPIEILSLIYYSDD
ncbi:helix-turn-helix domain-containing protein [Reinekea thalattae]|uniref:Cupin domain-containing protein n=1 Tax=Reinekea thalattae TaxID=2593301 RepID=A0A5C8Z7P4_9GAMM|nr:XRE family transcriptional regulator [Reinekea thalattae]TXR53161.1 cupin domain-containing protein [Reinekea thalattae]